MNISPTRQAILDNLGNVWRHMDGEDYHQTMGRRWKVTAQVRWLLANGLIEENPDDADLHVRGYRHVADKEVKS